MGEESWPPNVVRSKSVVDLDSRDWGRYRADVFVEGIGRTIVADGPRPIICADCGRPIADGLVVHLKPETYTVRIKGEDYYLERHIGVSCGCARKRGLVR